MRTKVKALEKLDQKKTLIFCIGAFCLALMCVLYGYFLHQAIQNVVVREKNQSAIAVAGSKVSSLEFSYIALKNKITPELATSLGFEQASDTIFIASNSNGGKLSYNIR